MHDHRNAPACSFMRAIVGRSRAGTSWAPIIASKLCLVLSIATAAQRDILTPPSPPEPRINGAQIYGVRPGHRLLYRIPATGKPPLTFSADLLPRGLMLDARTGIITGRIDRQGFYEVKLGARNAFGRSEKKWKIMVGDRLALTPPMGWSSWYSAFTNISDASIRAQANALISTGLVNHGYSYIEIDDGWNIRAQSKSTDPAPRDAAGNLKPGASFPNMNALTAYLHGQGLKVGLYTSPGPETCGKYAGSFQHERQDAALFVAWGFDLLKYDLCSYESKFLTGHDDPKVRKPYEQMGLILASLDRDVVYSLCQYGYDNSWVWARAAGGNTWRTTDDLGDDRGGGLWKNVVDFGFGQAGKENWAGPGGWNDPDNLMVGQVIWHDKLDPTPLTHNEQYTHFTLWAMLASPLIIGGDLTRLDAFTVGLLSNDEVIALDQDILGKQATPAYRSGSVEVWTKKLRGGAVAVAFFNRGERETVVSVPWSELGIHGRQAVRDLWRQRDLGEFADEMRVSVGEHGAELILASH